VCKAHRKKTKIGVQSTSQKNKRNRKMKKIKKFNPFTLIELLIVIIILAALAGSVSPRFVGLEQDAKDATDAYNAAGIVRYVDMFNSANGVFPSGMHTGLDDVVAAANVLAEVPAAIAANMLTVGQVVGGAAKEMTVLTVDHEAILKASGFINLGIADIDTTAAIAAGDFVPQVKLDWFTDSYFAAASGFATAGSTNMTFNGLDIPAIITAADALEATSPNSFILPLIVTPYVEWDTAYLLSGLSTKDSAIQVATTPTNSTVAEGEWGYYTCMFLVQIGDDATNNSADGAYSTTSNITLLGVISPLGVVGNP